MEIVLSIAGSDPSAGAGIQQDLKTISRMGCYAATVITALTSQNTIGVQAVMPVPPDVVQSQMQSVFDDLDIRAVKIGQIPDKAVAQAVVATLSAYLKSHPIPVVYDPVMISTSGTPLMQSDCIRFVQQHLFPLCRLITPNLPETAVLTEHDAETPSEILIAGQQLVSRYHTAFLLKGGHALSAEMTDHLFLPDGTHHSFSSARIETTNLHGTGCTLSSAIASALALGLSLPEATERGKRFVNDAILRASSLHIGKGNGPILA